MDERLCKVPKGQTLIELAVVLPCFCMGVFMGVQLIYYCHNMIELQRMAQVAIDRVSYENYEIRKKYTRFQSLWGPYKKRPSTFGSEIPQPWRPFKGISTIKNSGRYIHVCVTSDLLPGAGFSRVFPKVTQQAFAATFLESSVPEEQ